MTLRTLSALPCFFTVHKTVLCSFSHNSNVGVTAHENILGHGLLSLFCAILNEIVIPLDLICCVMLLYVIQHTPIASVSDGKFVSY